LNGKGEMKKFFSPDSVAVFGVSASPSNLGRNIVSNMQRFGFKGIICAVGKDGGEIDGVTIYPSIEGVAMIPDLAVFILPARHIPEALEACGRKGIRHAIIESAGFSEYAEEGQHIEREVLEIARRWGIRVVGPNCLGIINLENGLCLPFVHFDQREVKGGTISLIAQSGGVVVDCKRLLSHENIGFSKLISMGNKLDVNENDFLDYLIADPDTHVIGIHLENVADGARLMELARQTCKPLVVIKANTNPTSDHAARFHTAALAGDDKVVSAALRQAGMHRVQNLTEMMDCFKVFSLPVIRGPRLAVLARSGGQGVMMADAVYRYGFQLAKLSKGFFAHVKQYTRAGVTRMTNPLDMGDIFNVDAYAKIIEKAVSEEGVDGVVYSHTYLDDSEITPTKRLVEVSKELANHYGKPVVSCIIPEKRTWFSIKEEANTFLFQDADVAIRALSCSLRHHRFHHEKPAAAHRAPGRRKTALKAGIMAPDEALILLGTYGIPVAELAVVSDVSEGVQAALRLGYPVALKMADVSVLHKTELGGVLLNIPNECELRKAFRRMKADRYLVQKIAPARIEVIVGAHRDNEFGHVVLFGLGGVFVELLNDTSLRVVPFATREAESMISEIRSAALLRGFRGSGPLDVEALARCVASISKLLVEHPEIVNIDINPILLSPKGEGYIAVDAKIEAS
jgi:acyl-CoA synthetase (NDP forming)